MTIYIDTSTGTWGDASGLVFLAETDPDIPVPSVTDHLDNASDSEINAFGEAHGTPYNDTMYATFLRAAYGLLGDGAGEEWDENREYTRGIVEVLGDAIGILGEYEERQAAILNLIRRNGTTTIYIVDEQGATFWYRTREEAEQRLVEEAWRGAAHLTINSAQAPNHLTDEQITEWAIGKGARDPGCDA